jgi:uncharacterized protein (DUF2249 family)/quercetin dioxygenase-like cupin family protein
MTPDELDVRHVPKPQRHPLIFERFSGLADGESFVLVNSHDPKHLHQEFERDHPSRYSWEYVETGPTAWRVRIGKCATTELPRVLCNAYAIGHLETNGDAAGALWKLEMNERHLDANLIRLNGGARIAPHSGPDLDVLVFVVAGSGELITNVGSVPLDPGHIAWLPRRSERSFHAGPDGLSYLTVHPRRPALHIAATASG